MYQAQLRLLSSQPGSSLRARWLVAPWLLVIVAGMSALARYESIAGPRTNVVSDWPADTGLPHKAASSNLVMFVHPRCPCTRAGVAELERLLNHSSEKVQVVIVIVHPEGAGAEWQTADFSQSLPAIRGTIVVHDVDGVESRRFGVETSGHVLFFDAAGRLQFSGGITPCRGQQGANSGIRMLETLIGGRAAARGNHAVFGCPLLNSSEQGGAK